MVRDAKRRDLKAIRQAGRRDRAPMLAILDALYGLSRKRGEYNGTGVSPVVPVTHPMLLSWTRKKWDISERSLRRLLPIMDELGLIFYQPGHGGHCSLVGLPTLYRENALFAKAAVEKDAEQGPRWWRPLCARLIGADVGLEPIDIHTPEDEDTYDLGFDLWDDEQVKEAEDAALVLQAAKQALEQPARIEEPTVSETPHESPQERAEAQREIAKMWRKLGDIQKAKRAERLAVEFEKEAVENAPNPQPSFIFPESQVASMSSHTPLGEFRITHSNSSYSEKAPSLSQMSETPQGDIAKPTIEAVTKRLQKGEVDDPHIRGLIESAEAKRELESRRALPRHAEHISCSWFQDGKWLVLQEEAHVLSDGAWATVVFKFRELDPRTDRYRPSKFSMRRYRRVNGAYRYTSGFNLTSERQMRDTVDVLLGFSGGPPSPREVREAA